MKIIQPPRKRKNGSAMPDRVSGEASNKKQFITAKPKSHNHAHKSGASDFGQLDDGKQTDFVSQNQQSLDQFELPPGKKRRRTELESHQQIEAHQAVCTDSNPDKKEFNKVLERGIRLLSMREHSVREMRDKLSAKSDNSQHVADVLDQLIEKKYLSDDRFTEAYIRARGNRGFGPVKIRSELKNKGITSILIEEYLDDNSSQWFDSAKVQYQKKYGESSVDDYRSWSKRARFLQSRGFSSQHIQCVIPQLD